MTEIERVLHYYVCRYCGITIMSKQTFCDVCLLAIEEGKTPPQKASKPIARTLIVKIKQ